MIQVLKPEYKNELKSNTKLKADVADANGVSTYTVDRWRYGNDPMLTTATNLQIIRQHMKLDPKTVMTEAAEIKTARRHNKLV